MDLVFALFNLVVFFAGIIIGSFSSLYYQKMMIRFYLGGALQEVFSQLTEPLKK